MKRIVTVFLACAAIATTMSARQVQLKSPDGRDAAFRELLKLYGSKLYWHIRRIVVSHDDAEDVMQETSVRILLGIDGYEGKSSLLT